MLKSTIISGTLICLAILVRPARGTEDVHAVFEELFGARVAEVTGTRDRADDVALAGTIHNAAEMLQEPLELRLLMYAQAFDLALVDSDGYDLAMRIMERVAELSPERTPEWDARRLRLLERRYRHGRRADYGQAWLAEMVEQADRLVLAGRYDEALTMYREASALAPRVESDRREAIIEKMRLTQARERAERRITLLQETLEKSPRDGEAAAELAELYVTAMNDPSRALAAARRADDPELIEIVELYRKPVARLDEGEAMKVADWCEQRAEGAAAQPVLLRRTRDALQRYVDLHGGSDVDGLKAKLRLDKLDARLGLADTPADAAPTSTAAPGPPDSGDADGATATGELPKITAEEADLIDWLQKTPLSEWKVEDGELHATGDMTYEYLYLPARPEGDYRLDLKIKAEELHSPSAYLRVDFPVGRTHSYVKMAANSYPRLGVRAWTRAHSLRLKARGTYRITIVSVYSKSKGEAGIKVTVNGVSLFQWAGPVSQVSPYMSSGDRPRIYFYRTVPVIEQATIKMLNGEVHFAAGSSD